MNQYYKAKIKKQFEELFGERYIYIEALQFGNERLEIKAMKIGIGREGWNPTMFVIPTTADENDHIIVDWEHPIIRPYDNKKDW